MTATICCARFRCSLKLGMITAKIQVFIADIRVTDLAEPFHMGSRPLVRIGSPEG